MQWFTERFARLRWLAVPLSAYVLVTVVLPLANGAAARGDFAYHTSLIFAGCALVVLFFMLGGVAWEVAAAAVRSSLDRVKRRWKARHSTGVSS